MRRAACQRGTFECPSRLQATAQELVEVKSGLFAFLQRFTWRSRGWREFRGLNQLGRAKKSHVVGEAK